ncbi:complement C1q-like protein 4 isoform X4 [Dreissena polymorpha]|uniref:complement C1q-like protein 4 isoform X4 n=1 Tax=Dreissena polymorpha TaxID=45954 RepID=UPI0022649FE7|nr:complement C1q-like protein 4 isoform X4 [Dreissena polymorpha]
MWTLLVLVAQVMCVTSVAHADETSSMSALLERLHALEGRERAHETELAFQRKRLVELESAQAQSKALSTLLDPAAIKKRLIYEDETVAFHATLDGTLEHGHVSQQILFNSVSLNIGGGYDANSGSFTAPMGGLYIFSTSVMSLQGKGAEMHAIIMKNGVEVAAAYANGMGGNMEQGSVTATVRLAKGDMVHVAVGRHDDTGVWGDKLTSFTGCLILPM